MRSRSIRSEQDATVVEFGLTDALIVIAVSAGLTLIATNRNGLFNYRGGKFVAP